MYPPGQLLNQSSGQARGRRQFLEDYFFFAALTFCVRAEAAADFASLLAVLLFKILAAEEATLALVVSVLPFCVSAEAATAFSAFVAVLLFKTFEAADATFLLVLSDFAMDIASLLQRPQRRGPTRANHARFDMRAESHRSPNATDFQHLSHGCSVSGLSGQPGIDKPRVRQKLTPHVQEATRRVANDDSQPLEKTSHDERCAEIHH
jgi:hypothetical protein